MKHFRSVAAVLAITASSMGLNKAEAKKDRAERQKRMNLKNFNKASFREPPPTLSPTYVPTTQWPTWVPTPAENIPKPSRRPTKKPVAAIQAPSPRGGGESAPKNNFPAPLVPFMTVSAKDDVIKIPAGAVRAFISVLDNDSGSNLVLNNIVAQATFGRCAVSLDLKRVVYIPNNTGLQRSDGCRYRVCNAQDVCDTASVKITNTAGNASNEPNDSTSSSTSDDMTKTPTFYPTQSSRDSSTAYSSDSYDSYDGNNAKIESSRDSSTSYSDESHDSHESYDDNEEKPEYPVHYGDSVSKSKDSAYSSSTKGSKSGSKSGRARRNLRRI
ncbi:hypothetical protein ACHAWF_015123 [Thalassiosira exigua]